MAAMTLNGWQRIWVALSVLWCVAVLSVTIGTWPSATTVNADAVVTRMSPQNVRWLYYTDKKGNPSGLETVRVFGPNCWPLMVPADTPADELTRVRGLVVPTPNRLASQVRAKFPGDYDDLPNDEIERRVLTKFPDCTRLYDAVGFGR